MTELASHLGVFLREHLPRDRNASRHTVQSYADSFQLLVCFAAERFGIDRRAKPLGDLEEYMKAGRPFWLLLSGHYQSDLDFVRWRSGLGRWKLSNRGRRSRRRGTSTSVSSRSTGGLSTCTTTRRR